MANPRTQTYAKTTKPSQQIKVNRQEPMLSGTFASVMLLGGFLLISWLAVFFLFISRN